MLNVLKLEEKTVVSNIFNCIEHFTFCGFDLETNVIDNCIHTIHILKMVYKIMLKYETVCF